MSLEEVPGHDGAINLLGHGAKSCARKLRIEDAIAVEEKDKFRPRPMADGLIETLVASSRRRERSRRIKFQGENAELARNQRASVGGSGIDVDDWNICLQH